MASFTDLCVEYFGTSDFYEVLSVNRSATDKEIKKAYHKLSLLVHPDRVSQAEKKTATAKFQALGKIHSILQDAKKRQSYDDFGDFEYDEDDLEDTSHWTNYWVGIFKRVELSDLEKYQKEYTGSELEKHDLKRAYVSGKGDMKKIIDMVPFADCDCEPRFIEIVRKWVDEGEVEEFDGFFNENQQKKARRRKKWEREKEQASNIDLDELQVQMDKNQKQRAAALQMLFSNLEAKYAPKIAKRRAVTGENSESTIKLRKRR